MSGHRNCNVVLCNGCLRYNGGGVFTGKDIYVWPLNDTHDAQTNALVQQFIPVVRVAEVVQQEQRIADTDCRDQLAEATAGTKHHGMGSCNK